MINIINMTIPHKSLSIIVLPCVTNTPSKPVLVIFFFVRFFFLLVLKLVVVDFGNC